MRSYCARICTPLNAGVGDNCPLVGCAAVGVGGTSVDVGSGGVLVGCGGIGVIVARIAVAVAGVVGEAANAVRGALVGGRGVISAGRVAVAADFGVGDGIVVGVAWPVHPIRTTLSSNQPVRTRHPLFRMSRHFSLCNTDS